jgi:hypothetical protein
MRRRTNRDRPADRERWYHDTGPYTGLAVALFVLGVLFIYVAVTNGDKLVWTEIPVHGSQRDGIVYYSFQGTEYSLDNAHETSSHPATVYVDAAHPYRATLVNPLFSKLIDVVTVGVPLAAAAALVPIGLLRKRSRARRRRIRHGSEDYVRGEEVFQRLHEERRREGPGLR